MNKSSFSLSFVEILFYLHITLHSTLCRINNHNFTFCCIYHILTCYAVKDIPDILPYFLGYYHKSSFSTRDISQCKTIYMCPTFCWKLEKGCFICQCKGMYTK